MDGTAADLSGAQVGEAHIGNAAGGNIYQLLADLPPGIRQALADGHEAQRLTILAMERQGNRVERLEALFRAYTTGEALERAEQYVRVEQRHHAEQEILMDGLGAIREQIADTNTALITLRADQRRAIRRLALGLAIVALIIVALLVDRAWAIWLAGLGGAALAYLRTR